MKLAYCITGSFCTHSNSLAVLEELLKEGNDVYPVLSEIVQKETTRFGTKESLYEKVTAFCGRKPILTVNEAESIITRGSFDCVIVCPCTGNTTAKIANGITDTTVTMAVKAQLRSDRKVILAIATNDALGANLKNIAVCLDKKNTYLVPLSQDSPSTKPHSMICNFTKVNETLANAVNGIQIQPVIG